MKPAILLCFVAVLGGFCHAQNQSTCPGPRHELPSSSCTSNDTERDISVRVAVLNADDGVLAPTKSGGGWVVPSSSVGPQLLAETVSYIERHRYRACDVGWEIVERTRNSFQRLGYFCVDVEKPKGQPTSKNEYRIALQVHTGVRYKLREVTLMGASAIPENDIRRLVRLKPGSIFDVEALRRSREAIRKAYIEKGITTATPVPNIALNDVPNIALNDKDRTAALAIDLNESGIQQKD